MCIYTLFYLPGELLRRAEQQQRPEQRVARAGGRHDGDALQGGEHVGVDAGGGVRDAAVVFGVCMCERESYMCV